jgi:hypothetical protein
VNEADSLLPCVLRYDSLFLYAKEKVTKRNAPRRGLLKKAVPSLDSPLLLMTSEKTMEEKKPVTRALK